MPGETLTFEQNFGYWNPGTYEVLVCASSKPWTVDPGTAKKMFLTVTGQSFKSQENVQAKPVFPPVPTAGSQRSAPPLKGILRIPPATATPTPSVRRRG